VKSSRAFNTVNLEILRGFWNVSRSDKMLRTDKEHQRRRQESSKNLTLYNESLGSK